MPNYQVIAAITREIQRNAAEESVQAGLSRLLDAAPWESLDPFERSTFNTIAKAEGIEPVDAYTAHLRRVAVRQAGVNAAPIEPADETPHGSTTPAADAEPDETPARPMSAPGNYNDGGPAVPDTFDPRALALTARGNA